MKTKENGLPQSRFGIVVSLKVHKKAVKRNLIRRRIREIIRKHLGEIRKGHDVMVLTQKESVEATYAELETQTLSCLKKLGLLL